MRHSLYCGLLGIFLAYLAFPSWAENSPLFVVPPGTEKLLPSEIPPALQPWAEWVLHDYPERTCPRHFNHTTALSAGLLASGKLNGICRWPTHLAVTVTATQADFKQTWQMYHAGWVTLPGNGRQWPQNVRVNDVPVLVAEEEHFPTENDTEKFPLVYLPAGRTVITGQFFWEQRPENLRIPKQTGLIELTVDGMAIPIPTLDDEGRLWLGQHGNQSDSEADEENRLELRVYRAIDDDIPLQIVTRIELDVAGRHREALLGPVLTADQIPMSLDSPLPARLEADGRLRIQVRPGSWTLTVRSRYPNPLSSLTKPAHQEVDTWVDEETWVFMAHHDLRAVEVTGVAAIDPQQTTLPPEWKQFPAYQMKVGDTLTLAERRRGDPEPAPDQLQLERQFWLDFDGSGYSVQDHISGTMTKGWRLEMAKPAVLGRVNANGEDQFITRLNNAETAGIEVRRGYINLVADSRLEPTGTSTFAHAHQTLPAVGWTHDFQKVQASIHLPPGWRLLNVVGAHAPDTWLKQWSLLDLFMVLILAIAITKLWRWYWGILALCALILSYQEPNAPHGLWLNLLAVLGLLRVLPTMNYFYRFASFYRNISVLALLLAVLPFIAQQIQQSLYPQLEYRWRGLEDNTVAVNMPATQIFTNGGISPAAPRKEAPPESKSMVGSEPQQQMELDGRVLQKAAPEIKYKAAPAMQLDEEHEGDYASSFNYGGVKEKLSKKRRQATAGKQLVQIDPNAKVQTGPGLPQWRWRTVQVLWNGPVNHDEHIQLWLLSPTLNTLVTGLRVLLVAGLVGFLLWVAWRERSLSPVSPLKPTAASVIVLVGLLAALPMISYADNAVPVPLAPPVATVESSHANNALPLAIAESGFPPQFLLDQLQTRLLVSSSECLPVCASYSRMYLSVEASQLQIRLELHSLGDVAVPLPGQAQEWLPQQVLLDGVAATALSRDNTLGQLWLRVDKGVHQIQLAGILPNRHTVQLSWPLIKPHFVEVHAQGWQVEGVHENGIADAQLQLTREQVADNKTAELEMGSLPPFVRIERTLRLGLDWQVETKVTRLTPTGAAVVLEIPLLAGESVMTEDVRVDNGKALINLPADESEVSWTSVFAKQDKVVLTAPTNMASIEMWRIDTSAIWHVELEGIPVVHHQTSDGQWLPEWRPWPGESITLHLSRPEGVEGQALTIDRSHLTVTPGLRSTDSTLSLTIRSSRGGQHALTLPPQAQLQAVTINGNTQPIRQEARLVNLPIIPGSQLIHLVFREPNGITARFVTPEIGLGVASVNTHIEVNMPPGRWILFADNSLLGPAVVFWGVLIAVFLAAIGLGVTSRRLDMPLKTWQWLLLGVVLSQVQIILALSVVLWFLVLAWRRRLSVDTLSNSQFDLIQLGMLWLTMIALWSLLQAIQQGLLGFPNMYISGNGSSNDSLRWYQDRTSGTLPSVWVISVSLWLYRGAMLAWALWLALALLKWLQWGWQCFSAQGLWKRVWGTKKSVQTVENAGNAN